MSGTGFLTSFSHRSFRPTLQMRMLLIQEVHHCFLSPEPVKNSRNHIESLLLNLLIDAVLRLLELTWILSWLLNHLLRAFHKFVKFSCCQLHCLRKFFKLGFWERNLLRLSHFIWSFSTCCPLRPFLDRVRGEFWSLWWHLLIVKMLN